MFFLSGLFVWSSLKRKGSGGFIRGRMLRLGLPFVVAAGLLAPIAYYPAYLLTNAPSHSLAGYWEQWRSIGTWPAGPAWFLWVLLAYGCIAAALHKTTPAWAQSANAKLAGILRRPFLGFCTLALLSGLAYVPMAQSFGSMDWKSWGPFYFQTSRILLYAVYFAAGIIFGAGNLERTFLSPGSSLSNRWILWPTAAVIAFLGISAVTIAALANPAAQRPLTLLANCLFPISCAASCFAFLSVFLRFARGSSRLSGAFCAAAYGIYVVHYPIVNWLELALTHVQLPAVLKGVLVITAALGLSWGLVALARLLKPVRKVI